MDHFKLWIYKICPRKSLKQIRKRQQAFANIVQLFVIRDILLSLLNYPHHNKAEVRCKGKDRALCSPCNTVAATTHWGWSQARKWDMLRGSDDRTIPSFCHRDRTGTACTKDKAEDSALSTAVAGGKAGHKSLDDSTELCTDPVESACTQTWATLGRCFCRSCMGIKNSKVMKFSL